MTDDERRFWRKVPIQFLWFLRGGFIAFMVFLVKMILEIRPHELQLPVILFILLGLSIGGLLVLFIFRFTP